MNVRPTTHHWARPALAIAILAWLAAPTYAGDMDPATGYRLANYRSPVTIPVEGGKRVALTEVDKLIKSGASLVDVMPARAGYDAKTGKWLLVDRRDDIPGSLWLPNVGQGKLEPRLAAYFSGALTGLTHGDPNHALIFYCMADCWMSWNAVKRAASLGYKAVYWYADGTDGWRDAGRALLAGRPPPVPPEPQKQTLKQ